MAKPRKTVLITDLDNTLWDWVAIWHAPFEAMLRHVVEQSGLPREVLEGEIRAVHQRHGTSEYAFVLEELPSLRRLHPGQAIPEVYRDAINAFRVARTEALLPYPSVIDTLIELRKRGTRVAAYTESLEYYTQYRLRQTGVDKLLDVIYSPPDHELPADREALRKYAPEHYALAAPHKLTPIGELKPNPKLLLDIVRSLRADPDQVVYVGDSLQKDVAMAQSAGITDVHAAYGASHNTLAYQLLRRVSHWTNEAIEREKASLKAPTHEPTIILTSRFAELLEHVDFAAAAD